MCQQDRRADAIEECGAGITIQLLLARKAGQRRKVLRIELIEDGVSGDARAWPLCVQPRLWPERRSFGCRESLLHAVDGTARLRADFRLMRRTGARGLIEDVDRVPLSQEVLHPA